VQFGGRDLRKPGLRAAPSLTYIESTPIFTMLRGRPIWFGGKDRSEASMGEFYAWLGKKKRSRIRLAVMDMWKPFRLATASHAPAAAILFDKFHIMRHLGEAFDALVFRIVLAHVSDLMP
jgi:transposase